MKICIFSLPPPTFNDIPCSYITLIVEIDNVTFFIMIIRCSRCLDSSECGSLLSAMLCERCAAEKKNIKEDEVIFLRDENYLEYISNI